MMFAFEMLLCLVWMLSEQKHNLVVLIYEAMLSYFARGISVISLYPLLKLRLMSLSNADDKTLVASRERTLIPGNDWC